MTEIPKMPTEEWVRQRMDEIRAEVEALTPDEQISALLLQSVRMEYELKKARHDLAEMQAL